MTTLDEAKEKICKANIFLPPDGWPKPLGEPAFHGLAGEIVREIEPHSEADPAALLIQILVAFGNVTGRGVYYEVEGDTHFLNLYAGIVGETSKARKGVSWGHIRRLFEPVDHDWSRNRIKSGLSSGEGFIWHIRDYISRKDPGVADKRLLVIETELASQLRILGREGSTLSANLRNAWDERDLFNLTKKSSVRVTKPHLSIIGHITREELCRYLSRTEIDNGFANRFLWVCVRRSKELPVGGRLDDDQLSTFAERLKKALEIGRRDVDLWYTHPAYGVWSRVYPKLSEGKPGPFGTVTARAEAQVMRLACIYATLDLRRSRIEPVHLEAALEVWRYCEDSARHIFGGSIGNPVSDDILGTLRRQPEGMTRTDIVRLFSNNVSKVAIDRALETLEKSGKVARKTEKKEGRGRPVERWQLRTAS